MCSQLVTQIVLHTWPMNVLKILVKTFLLLLVVKLMKALFDVQRYSVKEYFLLTFDNVKDN